MYKTFQLKPYYQVKEFAQILQEEFPETLHVNRDAKGAKLCFSSLRPWREHSVLKHPSLEPNNYWPFSPSHYEYIEDLFITDGPVKLYTRMAHLGAKYVWFSDQQALGSSQAKNL